MALLWPRLPKDQCVRGREIASLTTQNGCVEGKEGMDLIIGSPHSCQTLVMGVKSKLSPGHQGIKEVKP